MIAFYRSASVASGRTAQALAFAKEIAAYIKDKVGVEVAVAVPIGGNPNRIGWSSRYENLSGIDTTQAKLMADPKYMEMIAKGAENFIPGSVHDEIWRSI